MANELDKNMNAANGAEASKAEAKPKKKSAVVFNAQYSKTNNSSNRRSDNRRNDKDNNNANRNGQNRGPAVKRDGQQQGRNDRSAAGRNDRPANRNGMQQEPARIIKPRPKDERALRPISERIAEQEAIEAKRQAEEAAKAAAEEAAAKAAEEAARAEAEAAAAKAAEEERKAQAPKTIASVVEESLPTIRIVDHIEMPEPKKKAPAEKKNNGERRSGDRDNRQGDRRGNGDRDNRQGDRRNTGDRDNRQGDRRNSGDRDNRQGDRRNTGDRDNRQGDRRNIGDRDNRQGFKPGDKDNRGFRGGDKDGRSNDRGFRGGDKDGRSNDRFGGRNNDRSAAPAAAEDVRGKESRNNRRTDGKRNTDHDNLGKKQENYVNLEKHGGKKRPQQQPQQPKEDPNEIKTLVLPEKMTIKELADAMKVMPSAIIKNLFMKGQMVTMNSEITYEDAEELALEFNFVCETEEKVDVIAELLKEEEEDEETMVTRPPVVCVMGHVDHGKTSLLDAIRSTRVTDREAGGITQHIGASVVTINGQKITFLDTPGHEAFTAMRLRGAQSTDIAILVVAADDGVMPQTIEAINHAKAAGVEVIVAVNKIDKPAANIERVKQEMTEYGLVAEDWGGSTPFCPVSAKTGEGIEDLLEMVLLTAEVMELKANPKRNARGLVIEAQLDKGRGSVATVLVQKGTLHVGDCVACGSSYGKVRAMLDDKGRRVKEADPSTPVEILGLNSVPAAGETFVVCDNEKEAKAFADTYITEEKNRLLEETKQRMTLESLFSQIQAGNVKELNLIVKADVQGSVEAVKASLMKLSNEEVVVKVIHGGVGAISESDVILASASNAIIIGFNVRPDTVAKATAERENVEIRLYNVIYNAIEEIERKMKGMKDPVYEEKILGHAEIRMIFKASGVGNIAGSYVMDGIIERGCKVRISREGKQIWEGALASLKRFKDDVKEVKTNYECGLVFDGFGDIQEFDIVEAYKMVEVPQ